MKATIEWDQSELDSLKHGLEKVGAAQVAASAQKIAGTRFNVTAEGTTVLSRDQAAFDSEYGDGVADPDPWALGAIRGASGRHQ